MASMNHHAVDPGSPVMVLRRRAGAVGTSQGIVAGVVGEERLLGLRVAGSPTYRANDLVVVVILGGAQWATDALFVRQDQDLSLFRLVSDWYQYERRATPRYRTNIRVTVVAPAAGYLARGVAIDLSEGGLRVAVEEEPPTKDVRVLVAEGADISLACHVASIAINDTAIELGLAFGELGDVSRRWVKRRVDDLRVLAEQGRDLMAS